MTELYGYKITHLRYARWSKCDDCGKKALDWTEGMPPRRMRKWRGCTAFGHGAFDCVTTGRIRMTTPMYKPGCKCSSCKLTRKIMRASLGHGQKRREPRPQPVR